MTRYFIALAAAIGFIMGLVFPIGSIAVPTGYLYSTWITAPTGKGPTGGWEQVPISCGWHRVCDYSYPDADAHGLDWPENNSKGTKVYFRGSFRRLNAPYDDQHLRGYAQLVQYGADVCDIVQTEVDEYYVNNWHYRWTMRYTHTTRSGSYIFAIPTTGTGNGMFTAKWVATMIPDAGASCPWCGPPSCAPYLHVHDLAYINPAYPKALPGWAENTAQIPGEPASTWWWTYDWSRYFEWAEAYP